MASSKNRIVKNASWIIVMRIVQAVMSLIVTTISARYLGPGNYGFISYAASLVSFVTPITLLGLENIQVQEYVNNPESEHGKILGTSISLSLFSAICCIFGIFLFTCVTRMGELDTIIVCTLYSLALLFEATQLVNYWFQAKLLSKYASIVSFLAYVLISIYKILLLVFRQPIYLFALATAFDGLLISVILLLLFTKKSNSRIRFSKTLAKRLLAKSKYYILPSLMVVIFTQTDRIMLSLMIGDSATGFYSAAATSAGFVSFFFAAIIDSARPVIFEEYLRSEKRFEKAVTSLYTIILYVSLLSASVFTLLAPWIIGIIYGADYGDSIDVFKVLSWLTVFSSIGTIRNIWILAKGEQKYLWIVNIVGAFTNVFLNFIFISYWGAVGAAISSVASQFVANIVVTGALKPYRRSLILALKSLDPRVFISYFRKSDRKVF